MSIDSMTLHTKLPFLVCLACIGYGDRLQGPSQVFTKMIFASHPTITYIPSVLGAFAPVNNLGSLAFANLYLMPKHTERHHTKLRMSDDSNAESTDVDAELLKIRAERAALEAKKAEIEAQRLELELQELKTKPVVDQAPSGASTVPSDCQMWPEEAGKFHRIISENLGGVMCTTRADYFGTRIPGDYNGSFKVRFTLPGKDDDPKTLELLQISEGKPSFGAVKVTAGNFIRLTPQPKEMPIGSSIQQLTGKSDPAFNKFVVTEINEYVNTAMILPGDIIRAISAPEEANDQKSAWWDVVGNAVTKVFLGDLPSLEEGMVVFDGYTKPKNILAAVNANIQANGQDGEIVVLIERPNDRGSSSLSVEWAPVDDD